MKVRFKENAYMNKINAKLWAVSWKNLSVGYPNKEMLSRSICGLGTYYINKVIHFYVNKSIQISRFVPCITPRHSPRQVFSCHGHTHIIVCIGKAINTCK